MNLDHLSFPDIGWGYMPPTDEVFAAFEFCEKKFRPRSVLEIGYHLGHSTTYQLEIYKRAKVVSVSPYYDNTGSVEDRVDQLERHEMAIRLENLYRNRWTWIPGKTYQIEDELKKKRFDFGLVDGLHSYDACSLDLQLFVDLNIRYFLVDNFEQGTVRKAVKDNKDLRLKKVFNYSQTFKNKVKVNKMALLKLDRAQLNLL